MKISFLPRLLFLFILFSTNLMLAQENDDLYFSSKDRELYEKNNPQKKKEEKKRNPETDASLEALKWKMTCTGLSSKSEKVFTGNSSTFLSSPRLFEDSLKYYFKGENISVSLTHDSTSLLLTDTINYREMRTFFAEKLNNLSSCEKMSFSYPEWLTPLIVEKNTQFAIDKSMSAPEGDAYLKISGKKKGTICSFSKYFKNEYANNYVSVISPVASADQTWIFFYAYGTGDTADLVQLMVYQTVYKKGVSTTILQKAFTYKIPLNFEGWKPIAVRYSDLVVPEGLDDTTERIPKDLSSIEFSLVTHSEDGEATVYLDHIMLLANR